MLCIGFCAFICGTLLSGIVRTRGLIFRTAVEGRLQYQRRIAADGYTQSHDSASIRAIDVPRSEPSDGASICRLSASEGYTVNARSEGYRLFISSSTHPGPAPNTMTEVSSSSRLRSRSTPLSAYLKTPKRRAVIRGMMGRCVNGSELTLLRLQQTVDRYV